MSSSEHQHRSLPRINQEGEAVLKATLPSLPPACPQHYPSAAEGQRSLQEQDNHSGEKGYTPSLAGWRQDEHGKGAGIPPCCSPFFPSTRESIPASTRAELGCRPVGASRGSWQCCLQGLGLSAFHCTPVLMCSPWPGGAEMVSRLLSRGRSLQE